MNEESDCERHIALLLSIESKNRELRGDAKKVEDFGKILNKASRMIQNSFLISNVF